MQQLHSDRGVLDVLAIDPGTTDSGVCRVQFVEGGMPSILLASKLPNAVVLDLVDSVLASNQGVHIAIERVASYGMAVGAEVFETCEWIGRFVQRAYDWSELYVPTVDYVYRKEEKLAICGSPRANDATIRQALIDRYAYGVRNRGKGTKKEPGFFYGFKADAWMAFAVAVTYADRLEGGRYGWRH